MSNISFRFRIYIFTTCLLTSLIAGFFPSIVVAKEGDFESLNNYSSLSYFDMVEEENNDLSLFPKLTGMIELYSSQKKIPDSECDKVAFHPCVIMQWKNFVSHLRGVEFGKMLTEVNNWANAHPYITDQMNWGLSDYWATPYQFMQVNGDCEDYVIAKYYSLRAAGIPAEKMRIMVVQDLNLGEIIHAVLGVYENNKLWILDNQITQVKEASAIYHYRPIYGANEEKWWRYYPKTTMR